MSREVWSIHLDDLLFAVMFFHVENSIVSSLLKISSKSWCYFGRKVTALGANTGAVLYSTFETAKANDLNVFEYVMTCLDELSKSKPNIEHLLPWQFAKR